MYTVKEPLVKVKCLINSNSPNLTIGKEYVILKQEDGKVFIVDDSKRIISYYRSRFGNEY